MGVTGASKGIGLAVARELAIRGEGVIVNTGSVNAFFEPDAAVIDGGLTKTV